MANELYRTYEVLVEESVHPDHPKRAKDRTGKPSRYGDGVIDGALRDTHMIFQDAVCYNTLCVAGLAGKVTHKSGARANELLNPLWAHLTAPTAEGGIKGETERVIRRLATHYPPLAGVTTADEFLNRVYSEPLRLRDDMTEAQQQAVLALRAKCYRILEKFGAPEKNGVQKCADMTEFKNNWAGLMADPDSDAEIPGNGAYDRIWRELQPALEAATCDEDTARLIDEALKRYAAESEQRNQRDCERDYLVELQECKDAVAEVEALPDVDAKKPGKLKKAKAHLEKCEKGKADHDRKFFDNRRENLATAVGKAFSKPFAAKSGADINLTDAEFGAARVRAAQVGSTAKENSSAHIRLHYKGGRTGSFENALFRYCVLRTDIDPLMRRAALLDFRSFILEHDPDEEPSLDGEWIKEMPFVAAGEDVAFRYFGKQCLGIAGDGSSPDPEFDKVAFVTAAEDVFKYKIRTDARKARVGKLLKVVRAYESNGGELSAEDSPTGKPLNVRGMGGDPRWKGNGNSKSGIIHLLDGMSDDKKIGSYRLDEGTIGGWAEVRKVFLSLHKKACRNDSKETDEATLVSQFVDGVDAEMEANRQGFGSADFFHELCEPDYWHLWLDGSDYERHGVKDFIPHYVTYCEWREELVGLLLKKDGTELEPETELSAAEMEVFAKKPIRHTWPGLLNRHNEPSYRYYDFTTNLNVRLPLRLFRRVRPDDDKTRVLKYEQLPKSQAVLTLSARRLKRDRILGKNAATGEWSSVEALYCPPLVLAGDAEPSPATKPRAGKKKEKERDPAEVSFSLIAASLPGDFWNAVAEVPTESEANPVHLTVSFKVEPEEVAKLERECIFFAGGSAPGISEDDEKRKFLRWPVDIESDKRAAADAEKKAREKAEKEGKPWTKPARKPEIAPEKLWCAFDGGFLVKESHYSPREKTKRILDFHLLSIDLGNRFAAAFTRMRIHADANGEGRVISADNSSRAIKAEITREGTLRLQGENAKVWDHVRGADGNCVKDANGNYVYAFEDETYGNGGRGRFPTADEYEKWFVPLAKGLVPASAFSLPGKEQTYPELGDHLGFRLKRRLGRLRTLFNLVWRLSGTHERNQKTGTEGKKIEEAERLSHRRAVIETLARSAFPRRPRQPGEVEDPGDTSLRHALAGEEQWQNLKTDGLLEREKGAKEKQRQEKLKDALKDAAAWNWDALATAVKNQIAEDFDGGADKTKEPPLADLVAKVVEFCLPLRGRHWRWEHKPAGERLTWGKENESPDWKPNVMGMRGLSMRRLQQVLDLRQRCQSFAKLEDRYRGVPTRPGVLGYKGFVDGHYDPPESTREERPDCCPKLLERSNRIREQRVDQTAHLILTEALGMELKNPADVADKKARKHEVDLHGEYRRRVDQNGKSFPRCSVIVLENLERYKMSLGRTKAENSRLMKWAHGKILDKLEDMCRPFGITLMLVDPAFSSHFDSRTGLPGVRVEEVSRGFELGYPYKAWMEGKTKKGGETKLAKDIKELATVFQANRDYQDTLLLAVEGGKEFLPVSASDGIKPGPINADINAAGNIGLRGVADPQRWDIFPRLFTRRVSESEFFVTNWRGWFGKFPKDPKDAKSALRRLRAIAANDTTTDQAESPPTVGVAEDSTETQTSQSSESPPFFVEHTKLNWPPKKDWLSDKAVNFDQEGRPVRAFRQSEYLKRVEQVCAQRIEQINRDRIRNRQPSGEDVRY